MMDTTQGADTPVLAATSPEALKNPEKYRCLHGADGKDQQGVENGRKRCFGTGAMGNDGSDVGGDGDLIYFHWQGCSWNHRQF